MDLYVLLTLVAIAASLFLMVDLYKGMVVAGGGGVPGPTSSPHGTGAQMEPSAGSVPSQQQTGP